MAPQLSYPAHAKAILALGLPLMASHLAQMALHVTDTVMLGWYGVEALAAVVLGAAFFFLIFILGSGFGIAVMGMVAAALGRGDEVQVRRDVRMGLWLSGLFSVLALPLFWWSGPVMRLLGQSEALAADTQSYLRVAGFGLLPALIVMVLKSYLSALERTGVVLWATLGAALLNVLVNWVLIFGHWGAPELGLRGAALASVVAQLLCCLVLAGYAAGHPALRRFRLFQRFWRPDWPAFGEVLRSGTPVGLTGVAEGGLFHASAVMMGWIGTMELAAHGIAMEVTALAFMVHLGLSNAATVRVGRALGEGDPGAMRRAALAAIGLSGLFGLLMVAAFLLVPEAIIGLYLDESRPDAAPILQIGVMLLALGALFQMFDAMQCVALGLLRGVQDTGVPMWLAALSYWGIGVPASYALAFPLGLGAAGLWLGLVCGLVAASVLLMARFWLGRGRGAVLAA